MEQPVFIVGAPRSGTTLLAQLLNDTKYGVPIETHFIVKLYKRLYRYGNLTVKENVFNLLDDIMRERAIMQRSISVDKEKFYSSLEHYSYSEIVDKFCRLIFEKKGKHVWGDKTPRYIFDFDVIYKLFPDAKFIYIVRDGRDVALSLLKEPWGPNNILSCAQYWKKANSHPLLDKLGESGKLYKVKYEDLLNTPVEVVREVYDFLDVELSEERVRELVSCIKYDNFDKWKTNMSPKQVTLFEGIARTILVKNGYNTVTVEGGVSPVEVFLWTCHNNIFRFFYLLKINTVDWFLIKYFNKEPFAS